MLKTPVERAAGARRSGFRVWRAPLTVLVLLGLLAPSLHAAGEFERGDANTDGMVNIADGVTALEYLFVGGVGYCLDAMDTNDDGDVDISDPISLINYLFASGPVPPAPFGACGEDPTPDNLGCSSHAPCNLGDAIPGLTQEELDSFLHGRELMSHNFTVEEGVGPLFNATSCEACHSTPTVGGSAPTYRNFFLVAVGQPPMQSDPPGLPSFVLPSYNLNDGGMRPAMPTSASVGGQTVTAAQRNAPPMFGVGLFEFVSNSTIIGLSDPNDSNGDGISGRFNADGFGNIGRFGYKAQANFIEAFIRGAAFNQMGITTNPVEGNSGVVSYKYQVGAGFNVATIDQDGVPDPEVSVSDFADIIAFNRFLAPPPQKEFTTVVFQGQTRFHSLGCATCHVPELPSAVGPLAAYSDLLLHDMGPGLADGLSMSGGGAQFSTLVPDHLVTASEFRTQPLWGVRLSGPWLHDGRADTLHEAILLHGGEAQSSRDGYNALTPTEQQQVIEFLEAL